MVANGGIALPEKRIARMLIDTHCHIDQFPSPEHVVRECERSAVRVVAVTYLPSHYGVAADRLRGNSVVCAALGMHPLYAHQSLRELGTFRRLAREAAFIGEIGLDGSRHGKASLPLQQRILDEVLQALSSRPRFITLHSRGAESLVLEALRRHRIAGAVFHWFTGPPKDLRTILDDGHFVSINPAMLPTASGQRVMKDAPARALLAESDGPFAKLQGRTSDPKDVRAVYEALSSIWGMAMEEAVEVVAKNFERAANGGQT